jgi:hypothetical protein
VLVPAMQLKGSRTSSAESGGKQGRWYYGSVLEFSFLAFPLDPTSFP